MPIDAIEQSFAIAAERAGDLTPLVYAKLFARHPEMEPLFARDTTGAVKGEMLARVIEAMLDFAGSRTFAARLIQCEVVTHAGYEVPPETFPVFFEVVAETVKELCGAEWSGTMEDAWTRMLAGLAFFATHPDQHATSVEDWRRG